MLNITVNNNGLIFEGDDKINVPLNSVILLLEKASDIVMFKSVTDYDTIIQDKWQNITINDEQVTKDNIVDKFNSIANVPQGGGSKINAGSNITLQEEEDGSITISATGELTQSVNWTDVIDKPSTFTPSQHTHTSSDITDLQEQFNGYATEEWVESKNYLTQHQDISNLATKDELNDKQDILVSGTNIKTINDQSILGEGNIAIEAINPDVTKEYVDDNLALKVDISSYEADKETFALKTDIPSIEDLVSSEELETALNDKQDTLVSGTNIKTINSQSILGEGNIEIKSEGGGITDAPQDGKLYGRKNEQWTEVVIPDTSDYLTKDEASDTYRQKKIINFNRTNRSNEITNAWANSLNNIGATFQYVSFDEGATYNNVLYCGYRSYDGAGNRKGVGITEIDGKMRSVIFEFSGIDCVATLEDEIDLSDYATTAQLANKVDVSAYTEDKATFATKEELNLKANTSDLSNYLQTSVAESTYAKKSEIPEEYTLPIATAEALGGIKVGAGLSINAETGVLSATGGGTADSVDWANITSKPETFTPSAHNHPISEVTELQDKLDAKADKTAIADMATQTWVTSQGYLTSHQDISNLATKQEVTEGLAGKQETLVSGTNIKTVNGESILGSGNIVIEGGSSDVDKAYVDEKLALKADKTSVPTVQENATGDTNNYIYSIKYNSSNIVDNGGGTPNNYDTLNKNVLSFVQLWRDSTTFNIRFNSWNDRGVSFNREGDWMATKDKAGVISGEDKQKLDSINTEEILTKTEASTTYQVKGDYALKSDLDGKQDTLVSSENIKTINNQSIIGSGDITIGGGVQEWDFAQLQSDSEYRLNFIASAKASDIVNNAEYSGLTYDHCSIVAISQSTYTLLLNITSAPMIAPIVVTEEVAVIPAAINIYTFVDSELKDDSVNPVQNKVITQELNKYYKKTILDLSTYEGAITAGNTLINVGSYTVPKEFVALYSDLSDVIAVGLNADGNDILINLKNENDGGVFRWNVKSEIELNGSTSATYTAGEGINISDTNEISVDNSIIALKSEIPTDYLTSEDLVGYETTEHASATYQPKGEYLTSIPSEYVTESELASKVLTTDEINNIMKFRN